jgi:hypothetical protein
MMMMMMMMMMMAGAGGACTGGSSLTSDKTPPQKKESVRSDLLWVRHWVGPIRGVYPSLAGNCPVASKS